VFDRICGNAGAPIKAPVCQIKREGFSLSGGRIEPTQRLSAYLPFGRCLAFCFALACGFGFAIAFLATGFLVVVFLVAMIFSP